MPSYRWQDQSNDQPVYESGESMDRKVFIFSLLVLMGGLFSGCGGIFTGGAPGYEVSAQSAKANVSVSYSRAYEASLETIRDMGGISEDKKSEGWVRTQLRHHYVSVHIEKLTDGTVGITVSARRDDVPKTQYAADVLAKIIKKINQQLSWMN
jgi:hypothetical protein